MADHIQPEFRGRRAVRLFAAMGAGLFIAGCTVGPDYEAPQAELSDRYSVSLPITASNEIASNWWEVFQDPVLNGLVERALTDSISLAEAQARIVEARAVARSEGVRLNDQAELSVTDVLDSGGDNAAFGLTLGLDLFGGQKRRGEAALARLAASEANAMNARRLLLSELALAYVDLRFNQERILLSERDLRSRRRSLNDINTLVERGEATKLDQLRAQALVAESEAGLPPLVAQVVRQKNRLTTLLGRPAASLDIDFGYSGRQPRAHLQTAPGVPADLLRLRPDIRQAERLYAAAVSVIGATEAARYPSLSLSGEIRAPLPSGSQVETLSAGLVVPVLQQGKLRAQTDQAHARANQAYLQWRATVLSAVEEVENGLVAIVTSGQRVTAARKVVNINQESLALSRQLLDTRGEITVLDLLDRERAISTSRTQLAQAIRDYAADYITLNTALGLGLTPPAQQE